MVEKLVAFLVIGFLGTLTMYSVIYKQYLEDYYNNDKRLKFIIFLLIFWVPFSIYMFSTEPLVAKYGGIIGAILLSVAYFILFTSDK